jgi:hypothetical protein
MCGHYDVRPERLKQCAEAPCAKRTHSEDETGGGRKPVANPVGERPKQGCPVEQELEEPAAPPVEGGVDQLAEMIHNPRLGAGGLQRSFQGSGGSVVAGAVASREDEEARGRGTHSGRYRNMRSMEPRGAGAYLRPLLR